MKTEKILTWMMYIGETPIWDGTKTATRLKIRLTQKQRNKLHMSLGENSLQLFR